jgi:hypothetical protein
MLFFTQKNLNKTLKIFIVLLTIILFSCTGSKKYFKAAEKLEKQGLFNEAASYYLESLQRKPSNVAARIKLKEVGQKHASSLASEFFRNYNTQQLEPSLETFERLKDFTNKTAALDVKLDYPKSYDEDYQKVVENYCQKNYSQAYTLVNQKKFSNSLEYIKNVKKYNPTYKTIQQLDIIAVCEPLYQSAVNSLESKNYSGALNLLSSIKNKTENYKDSKDLLDLSIAQQSKSFMLFAPKSNSNTKGEKDLEDYLFTNFSQVATQKFTNTKVINNTPFVTLPDAADINSAGNIDLIQAIRKATGSDYFYVYDVSNKNENNSGPQKQSAKAFQEVKTRKNDTLIITTYNDVYYNTVKANRSYSFEFKYKLINAYSNQIVASQTQNVIANDAIEYNEFSKQFNGNINTLYPYNPSVTAPIARYNPNAWRGQFSAKSTLKSFDELKNDALNKTINVFTSSISTYIK